MAVEASQRPPLNDAITTEQPVVNIEDRWSGRAAISLGGEYGGLGVNYKIWSGDVRIAMPF